jgi:photosystem II stability/assembly factor-like uncharacterized protein
MRTSRAAAAALAALLSSAASLPAAGPAWTPIGPQGGPADSLAIDPSDPKVIYAGAYGGGAWKSTDGGATWKRLEGVPVQQSVDAVAALPRGVVLAGTYDAGIWRSSDGGATWKAVHKATQPQERLAEVHTFAVDPKNSSIVYAGTDSTGSISGVLKSTDGGVTWKESDQGLVRPYYARVFDLAVHPTQTSTIYAATSEGLWRSTDAAATWAHVESGIGNDYLESLAIDSAGTVVAGAIGEIWRSTDGNTWQEAKSAVDIGGDTVSALVAVPGRPGAFFAGLPNHVLRSTDGGASWSTIDDRFEWITFRSLAMDPAATLYAGTSHRGVIKTSDEGKSWTPATAGYSTLEIWSILVDPSSPKTIYLASSQGGVYKSTDGGAHWEVTSEGLTSRAVKSLAMDPANPAHLIAGTRKGIQRSTDGGKSWKPVLTSTLGMEVETVRFIPGSKRVYARDDDNVFRSDDGGATWTEMKPALDIESSLLGRFALAADPAAPDTVLANTHRKLWRSTDGAKSWTVASGIPEVKRIQIVVPDPAAKTLIAGTDDGIYVSPDAGTSWTLAAKTEDYDVQTLLVDPATPGTMYAGTWRKGILRSKDGGKSWSRLGGDPPHLDCAALALEPGTSSLLVGFGGAGVWRLDIAAAEKAPAPAAAPAKKK